MNDETKSIILNEIVILQQKLADEENKERYDQLQKQIFALMNTLQGGTDAAVVGNSVSQPIETPSEDDTPSSVVTESVTYVDDLYELSIEDKLKEKFRHFGVDENFDVDEEAMYDVLVALSSPDVRLAYIDDEDGLVIEYHDDNEAQLDVSSHISSH